MNAHEQTLRHGAQDMSMADEELIRNRPPDPINQPPHYLRGGIEVIDYIEAKEFGYRLGSVIKYVSRAGHKEGCSRIHDLLKAQYYLNREIETELRDT